MPDPITLKFCRLVPHAILPTRAHETDAGLDLYAAETLTIPPGQGRLVSLGIASEIPASWHAQIWDRSSLGQKGLHRLCGIIDAGYRGEWKVMLVNLNEPATHFLRLDWPDLSREEIEKKAEGEVIQAGDKIAQALILPVPAVRVVEVQELSGTERGQGGFGSTGR